VKQIVGGTLTADATHAATNFESDHPARWYGELYRKDNLAGGHVIKLGPGNDEAAESALAAWPGGFQIGGGITPTTAQRWLDAGASHVIITSFLFEQDEFSKSRLVELGKHVAPEKLVIDLSCRRGVDGWYVATNKWQTVTRTKISEGLLRELGDHCAELLVHAADVEGLCRGIDEELVSLLGEISPLPCTYAGGGKAIEDLDRVRDLTGGKVDLTFGSSLDLFGGTGVRYADCVAYNRARGC
jgi:phosphoribosylformimino-5-aminoimidazole carboxamide ribotide isomerase